MRDLSHRNLQPEQMDQPGLGAAAHRQALRGLTRLNRVSDTVGSLWRQIRRRFPQPAQLQIFDIACGGGDIAVQLWRRAQRGGYSVHMTGLDISPTAVERARQLAAQRQAQVDFEVADVLREPLPAQADILVCSLFLHHLNNSQAEAFLAALAAASPRLLLLSDLRRCRSGYALAHLACRALSRSPIVHFDGPQSVAAAFTLAEVQQLCAAAGLVDAKITKAWPCRLLLQWQRPPRE